MVLRRTRGIAGGALILALLMPPTLLGGGRHAAVVAGSFWIQHSPAAGSQATITQAAGGAGVRNVVDAVSFGFSATTALGGITTVTVNLRDGATGAGTILQSWQFTLAATTQAPFALSLGRLRIQGSVNTATTLEFASATGNLLAFVSLSGYTTP